MFSVTLRHYNYIYPFIRYNYETVEEAERAYKYYESLYGMINYIEIIRPNGERYKPY